MLLSEYLREFVDKNMKKHLFLNHFHSVFHSVDLGQSDHPSHHPINGVPDADTNGQHDSWPAQGCLSELPGIDADYENAGYDADDLREHVRIPRNIVNL